METGNRTAGNGYEQDREHGAQLGVVEAGEHGQVHRGVGDDQQADDRTGDHRTEHEGSHVITGLFEQPHGQNSREEDVNKGDVAPGCLAEMTRGTFAPTTKDSTMKTMPMTASFQPEKLNFFWIRPKMTAKTMNMMETMPAEPLV